MMNDKDTMKMLKIIEENKKKYQLAEMEKKINIQKREKKEFRKRMIILSILMIAILIFLGIYTNKHVKDCMDHGNSYEFCKFAGE